MDQDRLVLAGWSAGGTLVDKLLTMTDRFKVASSGAGISNWISLYGQTDNTSFRRTWFGGTPWRKNAPFDLFWNNSPIKDVSNVKTPTLFFAGEADARVPKEQSVEMYRALKSLGVATQLVIAPYEGHVWGALQHLLRIQPDSHAVLTNTEDVDIRYAVHPRKFVPQLQCGVVTNEKSVVIVLWRSECDDLQDGSGFLLRYDALLLDCLW